MREPVGWVGLTPRKCQCHLIYFPVSATSISLIILVCILEQFLVVPVQLGVHDLLVLDPDEALVLGHVRHVGPEHLHTTLLYTAPCSMVTTSLSLRTPDRPPLVDRWNRMSDLGLLPSLALGTVSMISVTTSQ